MTKEFVNRKALSLSATALLTVFCAAGFSWSKDSVDASKASSSVVSDQSKSIDNSSWKNDRGTESQPIVVRVLNQNAASVWIEISKAFVGAFLGAGLAFASSIHFQKQQRRRENIAAGRLALAILSSQLDDFYNIRRALLNEHASRLGEKSDPKTSAWLYFRPMMFTFSDSLKFDFSSLVFLLEQKGSSVIGKVSLAEKRYFDLKNVLDQFNPSAELIQKRLEELGVLESSFDVLEIEKRLGPVLVGKGNSHGSALMLRIQKDEKDYLQAINALSAALTEMFGEKAVPKVLAMPGFGADETGISIVAESTRLPKT